jgi:DNA polymerase III delta prime subunit
MAFDLSNLKTTTATHPPRLLIYGPPGLGKTTLASEFPGAVIMNLEGGVPMDIHVPTLGDPEELIDWNAVISRLTALYTQEHDFKTLITDSLDRLETLAQRHVCAQNKWASIEDAGYGKGYVLASELLRNYLEGCNALRVKRNMNIVYIAHSTVTRFDDPQSAPYSKYDIRLNKHVNAMFEDDVDMILFVNQDVSVAEEEVGFGKTVKRAEGGGFRWIYTEARPAFNAKNRYGMPPRLKYDKGQGYSALKPYLPGQDPVAKKEAA